MRRRTSGCACRHDEVVWRNSWSLGDTWRNAWIVEDAWKIARILEEAWRNVGIVEDVWRNVAKAFNVPIIVNKIFIIIGIGCGGRKD